MLFAIESALAIFHRALSEAWVDPPGVADPADDLFAVGFFRSYAGRGGQPIALTSGDELLHRLAVSGQAGRKDPPTGGVLTGRGARLHSDR